MNPLWLLLIGFAVGAYGTLIGAGGGFILVPVLLFLYPEEPPARITAISLAVVFFNALSGSFAYARARRIDYRTGLTFAAVTIPGAIVGAIVNGFLPRGLFDVVFGLVLVGLALLVIFRPVPGGGRVDTPAPGMVTRVLVD